MSIYAVLQLWQQTTPVASWLGLLLAASPIWIFVIIKGMRPQKPEAAQAFGVSCICGAGLAITMTASWKYGDAAGTTHLWAGGCLLAWVLYLKWYNGRHHANSQCS